MLELELEVRYVTTFLLLFWNLIDEQLRASIVTHVYRKALSLSNGAKNRTSPGSIVNIMANDAQRLVDTSVFIGNVICAPVQVIGTLMCVLFYQILI